jgi:hypothetical protein
MDLIKPMQFLRRAGAPVWQAVPGSEAHTLTILQQDVFHAKDSTAA